MSRVLNSFEFIEGLRNSNQVLYKKSCIVMNEKLMKH